MFFPLTQKSFLCKQTFGKTHEIHNFTRLKLEIKIIQTGTINLSRYPDFLFKAANLKTLEKDYLHGKKPWCFKDLLSISFLFSLCAYIKRQFLDCCQFNGYIMIMMMLLLNHNGRRRRIERKQKNIFVDQYMIDVPLISNIY